MSLDKIHTLIENATDYVKKMHCDVYKWTRPFKCAVPSCPNAFLKFDTQCKLPFKFHNFPLNARLKQIWMEKCGIKNETDTLSTKVCSDHFNLDDYERNYKEEFKNPNYKRKLKADAVPTRNLDGVPVTLNFENDEVFAMHYENPTSNETDAVKELPPFDVIKSVVDENYWLKQEIEKLQFQKTELSFRIRTYNKKVRMRKKDVCVIRNLYEKLLESDLSISEQKNLLSKVFSDAQVNVLLGKKKVIWSPDDLAMAFTLRQMSSRECYLYLKQTLNMPLPALSCVQKWASSK